MSQMVEKNTFALALAEGERTTFNTSNSLALYQNTVTPSPNMTTADLTLADYDGYGPLACTFAPVFVDSGNELVFVQQAQFDSVPGLGTLNNVRGLAIVDGSGNPLAMGNFDAPVPMGLAGQSVSVVIEDRDGALTVTVLPV